MSKDHYEENDERMNIIGQNGNEGLHYAEADKKQVTHREACEKIADMQVDSMTVEELKQYVYEELVELMFWFKTTRKPMFRLKTSRKQK